MPNATKLVMGFIISLGMPLLLAISLPAYSADPEPSCPKEQIAVQTGCDQSSNKSDCKTVCIQNIQPKHSILRKTPTYMYQRVPSCSEYKTECPQGSSYSIDYKSCVPKSWGLPEPECPAGSTFFAHSGGCHACAETAYYFFIMTDVPSCEELKVECGEGYSYSVKYKTCVPKNLDIREPMCLPGTEYSLGMETCLVCKDSSGKITASAVHDIREAKTNPAAHSGDAGTPSSPATESQVIKIE